MLAQLFNLTRIVPKKCVAPDYVSSSAAVFRHFSADSLVVTKTRTLERLRFAQGTKDKDPIN